ncbi:ribosomal protein L22/L17 [Sporodiniella umbellata]|nr:ribosomal protein L22/L17 [Sporodiniella umbellata]
MSVRSLTSSLKTLSLFKQPAISKACLSTSALRSAAEQPANERPQTGASSLFDSVQVQSETAVKEGKPAEKEYRFSSSNFRASPQKLNMLARQIRNLPVDEAIRQMEFSDKRTAKKVLHNLAFAKKNAADQKDMHNLIVSQAWVGKGTFQKRVNAHGRGQFGIKETKRAHIKFLFKEATSANQTKLDRRNIRGWKQTKKVWTPLLETKPVYNPKPFYNW